MFFDGEQAGIERHSEELPLRHPSGPRPSEREADELRDDLGIKVSGVSEAT